MFISVHFTLFLCMPTQHKLVVYGSLGIFYTRSDQ